MPKLQSSQHGPFTGVNASSGAFDNPKGTVPRASNLIPIARGALATCDGSSILAWHSGEPQPNDTRFMAMEIFEPTGVQPYYLALKQVAIPMGAPSLGNSAFGTVSGSLTPGHEYVYAVTTLDGVGGESIPTIIGAIPNSTGSIELTWNGVPNAFSYNIYRQDIGAPGPQLLVSGANATPCGGSVATVGNPQTPTATGTLPVLQICGGPNLTFTWVDDGSGTVDPSAISPPTINNTQQTALLKISATSTLDPVSYDNTNIVAVFPPPVQRLSVPAIVGNLQISAGSQQAGQSGVQLVKSPNGIIPQTSRIRVIEGFSNGGLSVSLLDVAPPDLQVGDTVNVINAGAYSGQHTVTSIGVSLAGLGLSGTLVAGPVQTGEVQFELVTINTAYRYTAANGSRQTISQALDNTYNNTFTVRTGGSGVYSITVIVPGSALLNQSGSGTIATAS